MERISVRQYKGNQTWGGLKQHTRWCCRCTDWKMMRGGKVTITPPTFTCAACVATSKNPAPAPQQPIDKWMEVYTVKLKSYHAKYPNEYAWAIEELDAVITRMREAFLHDTYNLDGRAIKATCLALGIGKTTRAAINKYLGI